MPKGNNKSRSRAVLLTVVILFSLFFLAMCVYIIRLKDPNPPSSSHIAQEHNLLHPKEPPPPVLLPPPGAPDPDPNHSDFEEADREPQKPDQNIHKAGNGCGFSGPAPGFLGGCASDCSPYKTLQKALNVCAGTRECGGVTGSKSKDRYELRSYQIYTSETGEESYTKQVSLECHNKIPDLPKTPYGDWKPPADKDLDAVGSFVDGQPTIFISIAAYRDPMCHTTIKNALEWAKYPSRLVFGVVEQNAEGDLPCTHTRRPCEDDPEQMLCKYGDNIRIDAVPAQQARGPTFGRHRADRMYNGEYFALQIDAHMYFVKDWDMQCIHQFEAAANDYAILSTYPSEAKGNVHHGKSSVRSTPGICKSSFLGDGLIRHGAAGEFFPDASVVGNGDQPILQPWWAAGLSFSRGHKIVRVPNDCCTPMTFNGEEFSMAMRHWTNGYDHYTFRRTVCLHPYARPKRPPLFWENGNRFPADADRSARRLRVMFGMDPPSIDNYDKTDIEKYGMGKKRPIAKFLKVFGISYQKKKVRNHCKGVQNCQMHKALSKYIRADMKGIDYEKVPDDIGELW